jgi:hypothetical protein
VSLDDHGSLLHYEFIVATFCPDIFFYAMISIGLASTLVASVTDRSCDEPFVATPHKHSILR